MAAWILGLTKADADAVHVAIEVPHGPVVESSIDAAGVSDSVCK